MFFLATSYWQLQLVPHTHSAVFLTPRVSYTCRPPDNGYTITFTTYAAGTVTRNTTENCHFFANSSEDGGGFVKEPCRAWEYDNLTFTNTLTTQFDLVCSSDYLRATYEQMYMFGMLVGAPLAGILSDRFGRKTVFSVGIVSYLILSIASCWLPSFTAILASRFFLGFLHPAGLQVAYVLAMEVCESRYRSIVGVLLALPWALGTIAWGIWAHLLRDWKWLQLAVSLPGLILLPVLWFLDESPRWLVTRGQFDRAQKILEKAAHWNDVQLPPPGQLERLMRNIQKETILAKEEIMADHEGALPLRRRIWLVGLKVFVLFRTPRLRRITLLIYLKFLMVSMVFFGIELNTGRFTINPFLYMSVMGVMDLPAYTLMAPILVRLGRKGPLVVCYFISGAVILGLAFVAPNAGWLVTLLALVGQLCVTSAFQVLRLYSTELFPTEVRLRGLATGILFFHATTMLCPTISEKIGPGKPWAPSLVFGLAAFLAGLATLPLPETGRGLLPDTVADLETTQDVSMNRADGSVTEETEMAKLRA
ncbi:organic cation transporter protein-like [Penaeus monodon]|uniref:organic cation transporter protein-like n=1 Tax=Penaeus monodon TaxID=6687 RepID=UPI0018A758E7|nr:organic cation transporter protein-like [Penaeus monodon]